MLSNEKWNAPIEMPAAPRRLEKWRLDLLGAAAAIRKYGWTRYEVGNEDHGFCLIGAIAFARGDDPNKLEVMSLTNNSHLPIAVKKLSQYLQKDLSTYNDLDAKSKISVLRVLTNCAKS